MAPPKEPQRRLSYVIWKENWIVPILTLECLSQTYGKEYGKKMSDYAKLGVLYYVIYNPHYYKRDKHAPLEIYRLANGQYMLCIGQPFFMKELGLAIGHESGTYREWQRDWLYWYNKSRTRLLTAEERAQVAFSEGEQKKAFEAAHKMLADGLDSAIIFKYTGISAEVLSTITND